MPRPSFSWSIALVVALACGGEAAETAEEMAPPPEEATAEEATAAERVARGEYLVEAVAGCGVCHTPFGEGFEPVEGMHLAGGLEFPETFGTWRSLNITPDERTGLGLWTDEQIDDAIRRGVRPGGDRLYPIMPYLAYNRLSDEDAAAIVAYLRTVPPVENPVTRAELAMPTPPAPEPAGEAPAADDPIARGEYLATIMDCAGCHTPRDDNGVPDMTRPYAGGNAFELPEPMGGGTTFAANVTPHAETGIGGWTEEEIADAITTMTRPDGTPIGLPMAAFARAWSRLDRADALAVAAYLKSLPPVENRVPPAEPAGGPGG